MNYMTAAPPVISRNSNNVNVDDASAYGSASVVINKSTSDLGSRDSTSNGNSSSSSTVSAGNNQINVSPGPVKKEQIMNLADIAPAAEAAPRAAAKTEEFKKLT
jgi:hypothetical protein